MIARGAGTHACLIVTTRTSAQRASCRLSKDAAAKPLASEEAITAAASAAAARKPKVNSSESISMNLAMRLSTMTGLREALGKHT